MEMTDVHTVSEFINPLEHCQAEQAIFGFPIDVLKDERLTVNEKRRLLASWASDANAVPHLPALRQLPDGSIVRVEEILSALKALDAAEENPVRLRRTLPWAQRFGRGRKARPRHWTPYRRWPWDDDDPPPCPAFAALRPRGGSGAAAAEPDLVPA